MAEVLTELGELGGGEVKGEKSEATSVMPEILMFAKDLPHVLGRRAVGVWACQ